MLLYELYGCVLAFIHKHEQKSCVRAVSGHLKCKMGAKRWKDEEEWPLFDKLLLDLLDRMGKFHGLILILMASSQIFPCLAHPFSQ